MQIRHWLNVLFVETWWSYQPRISPWVSVPYHYFNLFEGATWVVLACLVLYRYLTLRRSPLELGYALAFATFGLTDFREAYVLSSWLIWLKLVNLIILLRLRSTVIRRFHPTNKLY